MKRKDEELCKRCFHSHLERILKGSRLQWEEVKDDPPDYYLFIDNKKYAVEVTTITDIIKIDSQEFPIATVIKSVERLLHEVKNECLAEGILSGFYVFSFQRPFSNFGNTRKMMKKSIIDYVQRTKDYKEAPEEKIIANDGVRCSIWKFPIKKQVICQCGPTKAAWEIKIQQEACRLLQHVINNKISKLININLPKILLLRNAYHFAYRTQMFKKCLPRIAGSEAFQIIFIVEELDRGYLLYGQDFFDSPS